MSEIKVVSADILCRKRKINPLNGNAVIKVGFNHFWKRIKTKVAKHKIKIKLTPTSVEFKVWYLGLQLDSRSTTSKFCGWIVKFKFWGCLCSLHPLAFNCCLLIRWIFSPINRVSNRNSVSRNWAQLCGIVRNYSRIARNCVELRSFQRSQLPKSKIHLRWKP